MFTSGTSGTPKGVPVSKKRWKQDVLAGGFAGQPKPTACSHMALGELGYLPVLLPLALVIHLLFRADVFILFLY